METRIILHHHLGLGDHFVCNGFVNYLSQYFEKIYLVCKQQHIPTISYLYSENDTIELLPIYQNEYHEVLEFATDHNLHVLRVGFEHCILSNWDRSFYKQLHIPFECRYTYFRLPKKLPEEIIPVPAEKFIAVHNQSSQGTLAIDLPSDYRIIYITKEACHNILSFLLILYKAEEIHCIDSSVFHLVDSLNNITPNLFFHDIRNTGKCRFQLSPKWNRVDYGQTH